MAPLSNDDVQGISRSLLGAITPRSSKDQSTMKVKISAPSSICNYYRCGFCRFKEKCKYEHLKEDCDLDKCDKKCRKRHRKPCKNFPDNCTWGEACEFKHVPGARPNRRSSRLNNSRVSRGSSSRSSSVSQDGGLESSLQSRLEKLEDKGEENGRAIKETNEALDELKKGLLHIRTIVNYCVVDNHGSNDNSTDPNNAENHDSEDDITEPNNENDSRNFTLSETVQENLTEDVNKTDYEISFYNNCTCVKCEVPVNFLE